MIRNEILFSIEKLGLLLLISVITIFTNNINNILLLTTFWYWEH